MHVTRVTVQTNLLSDTTQPHMHLLGRTEENQNKPQTPSQGLSAEHPKDEGMVYM
jgi:hypothetical protein